MLIEENTIDRLQKLAQININDKDGATKALNEIVGFVQNLQNVDVSRIDAINYNPAQGNSPLRQDEMTHERGREAANILEVSEYAKDGFFVVPKIIE